MTLQSFCLNTIAKNFDQVILDKNLEYLKRRFSVELLSRLNENNNLKEEYTDILINKRIRTLDTKWLQNYSWDKVASKVAEIGHNIEELLIKEPSCSRTPTIEPWHDLIRYFPKLKKFTFLEGCYDTVLENIAKFCANIEEIDSGFDNKLTGVKYLCQDENGRPLCRNLKELFIEDIEKEDLKYLVQKLPSLVEISGDDELPRVLYSLHILSPLDKVKPYKFTTLHIADVASDIEENFFKVCLSLCPNLKDLACQLRSAKQLDYLSSYLDAKVEHLWLRSLNPGSVTECNVNNFLVSKGEKINDLHLMFCSVSASVLSKSCPRLERLILRGARFCFEDDSTAEFHSLNDVSFVLRREPEDIGVNRLLLSLSKQLKCIEFDQSDLSSSELQASLLRCCEQNPVERLILEDCKKIEMTFLKQVIVRCPTLNFLNVERCFEQPELQELLEFVKTRPNKIQVIHTIRDLSEFEGIPIINDI